MPRKFFASVEHLREIPLVKPVAPPKAVPKAPGRVLIKRDGYLVWWKFKTKKPPRPKNWVTLIVFLADPRLRRRSYKLVWNGQRFGQDDVFELLRERHPDILAELPHVLAPHRERLVKPARPQEDGSYD